MTVAFWDCAVGAAVVAPVLVVAGRIVPDVDEWAAVLGLGVLLTGVSTLLYDLPAARLRPGDRRPGRSSNRLPVFSSPGRCSPRSRRSDARRGALVLAAGLAVVLAEPSETGVADAPAGIGSSP